MTPVTSIAFVAFIAVLWYGAAYAHANQRKQAVRRHLTRRLVLRAAITTGRENHGYWRARAGGFRSELRAFGLSDHEVNLVLSFLPELQLADAIAHEYGRVHLAGVPTFA